MKLKILDRNIIGSGTAEKTLTYTWRDLAIYAVGVGAKADELQYQYEKDIKAIPTFAATPYWGTFNISPYYPLPHNACFASDLDRAGSLHMAHELIMYKPLNPEGDTITFKDTITEVYDRGGKGVVIRTDLTGYDRNGEKVFTNIGDNLFGAYTSPDSPLYPKSTVAIPDREADITAKDYVAENQHLLYRLSGDTNLVHVDPEEAKARGFAGAFMQGLCSYGFVARMAIRELMGGDPDRFKSIGAQMRGIMYPGTDITLKIWKTDENSAVFRLLNSKDGSRVLEKGTLSWY